MRNGLTEGSTLGGMSPMGNDPIPPRPSIPPPPPEGQKVTYDVKDELRMIRIKADYNQGCINNWKIVGEFPNDTNYSELIVVLAAMTGSFFGAGLMYLWMIGMGG